MSDRNQQVVGSKRRGRSRGQGQTEYILTVLLIGIAAILVVTWFGDTVRSIFGASTESLNGTTGGLQWQATPGGRRPSEDRGFTWGGK